MWLRVDTRQSTDNQNPYLWDKDGLVMHGTIAFAPTNGSQNSYLHQSALGSYVGDHVHTKMDVEEVYWAKTEGLILPRDPTHKRPRTTQVEHAVDEQDSSSKLFYPVSSFIGNSNLAMGL